MKKLQKVAPPPWHQSSTHNRSLPQAPCPTRGTIQLRICGNYSRIASTASVLRLLPREAYKSRPEAMFTGSGSFLKPQETLLTSELYKQIVKVIYNSSISFKKKKFHNNNTHIAAVSCCPHFNYSRICLLVVICSVIRACVS